MPAVDPFYRSRATDMAPIYKWEAVTPDDDTDFDNIGVAIMLLSADTSKAALVKVKHDDDSTATYPLVGGGSAILTSVKAVFDTDTTMPSGVTQVLVAKLRQ